ncbi:MAG: proton-conducting transporter membrane subunit, partial [Candidatus Cloacimonadota bacterium]|nr:proton-conducting transporter membrane subunit [Candidatus Cloacimonadota bacterium]
MVSPLAIFIVTLTIAFLMVLFYKFDKYLAYGAFYGSLTTILIISIQWLYGLLLGSQDVQVFTAGFKPPLSINLQMGMEEALFLTIINTMAFLTAIYLLNKFRKLNSPSALILFLMMTMGLNGIVLTRDLFNLFVFVEISSIATYGLLSINKDIPGLSAGLKYIIAGSIASAFLLLGIIFVYHLTGTLNIDDIMLHNSELTTKLGSLALFLIFIAFMIELKPFPANGWALDVYQTASPAIAAFLSVASSGAMFFAIYKILPLLSVKFLHLIAILGMASFVFSNLIALKQKNAKRLLGYSSIGQVGLLLAATALVLQFTESGSMLKSIFVVLGGLFINHFIAKAGLFWLSGIVNKENCADWKILQNSKGLLFIFGIFIFALLGFPPFPGFWAKWELVKQLANNGMNSWIIFILLGSLFEIIYLLRWFGHATKDEIKKSTKLYTLSQTVPSYIAAFAILFLGLIISRVSLMFSLQYSYPILAAAILFAIHWMPSKFKGLISILLLAGYGFLLYPYLSGIRMVFAFIFLVGGFVQILATLAKTNRNSGFYPFLLMMLISLGNLLWAETTLEFFLAWEFMTIASYFLILQGKKAKIPALRYIVFSTAGAFLLLAGFSLAFLETGSLQFDSLAMVFHNSSTIFVLLSLGFLIKSGAIGLHIWLPASYAEAEDDTSSFLSSILSKSGLFGLMIVLMLFGKPLIANIQLNSILGWIGILTAFFGALLAVFQEDVKYLLAYSSMSQIGYMIAAAATLTHLGWVSSLYLAVTHLFFKGILFLAIAGVIAKIGTRYMYEMGGLIKKMPLSFISVLIAIIALSGVPPLSGFGGKWLFYTALIEKGWYLQAGLAFFASAIAFLYLFRLIHTIFLGQLKSRFQNVTEASAWYLIPQYIFIFAIMGISMYPNLIIKPLISAVQTYFGTTIQWQGYTVISSLGYWNGNAVMMVTMAVFILPLIWLLLRYRSMQKVQQFNIVYAAERPNTPETTHFAHNFYASYKKALGFWVQPIITRFWKKIDEWTNSTAAALRHIYTGNGQTYALHIIFYAV